MKEVEELYESWLNGNLKYVVEQIVKKPKLKAIQMAMDLAMHIGQTSDYDVLKKLVGSYKKPT